MKRYFLPRIGTILFAVLACCFPVAAVPILPAVPESIKNALAVFDPLTDPKEKVGSKYREFFMADISDGPTSATAIDYRITSSALSFMHLIVQKDWLPEPIPLEAYKDVEYLPFYKSDNPAESGLQFGGIICDYVATRYEMKGHRFFLYENGVYFIVRIDFPSPIDIDKDPALLIRDVCKSFLNVSDEGISSFTLQTGRVSNILHGSVNPRKGNEYRTGTWVKRKWWWQDTIKFLAYDRTIFIQVHELSGEPKRYRTGWISRF